MGFTHLDDSGKVRMVDVSEKSDISRLAIAEGVIKLRKETLKAILENRVAKGNVFSTAIVAATLAAKKTPELVPMCHPIPISYIDVSFETLEDGIRALCIVKSTGKTGVEMEALTAVSVALLTVWDMVKSIEKDESGNYPETAITEIRVVRKEKA
jgi:cyclic pyranopterin phosphate synthase